MIVRHDKTSAHQRRADLKTSFSGLWADSSFIRKAQAEFI